MQVEALPASLASMVARFECPFSSARVPRAEKEKMMI